MTRTPREAQAAVHRRDDTILWGYGAHPGIKGAMTEITPQSVLQAVEDHLIIGEIGLDRSTALAPQQEALATILEGCAGKPVLLSLHSTGRTAQVVATLTQQPHPGAILHWFNGTREEVLQAVDLGCYFSVNAAMSDERIAWIPLDRLLPETDFPSSRRSTHAKLPGDITYLESRIGTLTAQSPEDVRIMWYRNLRDLTRNTGVDMRMPERIQSLLRVV